MARLAESSQVRDDEREVGTITKRNDVVDLRRRNDRTVTVHAERI